MKTPRDSKKHGFSLAEMMIALAILGFGLLVVGAAIPVGLSYSRQSVDLVAGGLAAEFGQDMLSQTVRLKRIDKFPPPPNPNPPISRAEMVFRPRDAAGADNIVDTNSIMDDDDDFLVNTGYEPLIKVRPFLTEVLQKRPSATTTQALLNLSANTPLPTRITTPSNLPPVTLTAIEESIEPRIMSLMPSLTADQAYLEFDLGRILPVLSANALVYPPVESFNFAVSPNRGYKVEDFDAMNFANENSQSFYASGAYPAQLAGMHAKLRDRRIVYTSFYRRVAYDDPGPNGKRAILNGTPTTDDADNIVSKPNVYEMIVVAFRLPTPQHRFPVYTFSDGLTGASMDANRNLTYTGIDSMTPVPQLLFFDELPFSPPYLGGPDDPNPGNGNERRIDEARFVPSSTLRFVASGVVGEMLPPGSIFIPARNDHHPSLLQQLDPTAIYPNVQYVGFTPHSPNALPIYTVRSRNLFAPDKYEIIVDDNGYYPWVSTAVVGDPATFFPVWIIPPAFSETSSGAPVFGDKSNIVSVSRRIVNLTEVE